MQLPKRHIKNHFLVWTIILTYYNICYPTPGSLTVKIYSVILESLNYMFVFYSLSLFIFPKFWKQKFMYLSLNIVLCFLLFIVVSYLNYYILVPFLGGTYYEDSQFLIFISDSFFNFFISGSVGIASFFYHCSITNLKIQAEKEKSLLVYELSFLKNQFNSHITFNFLNYCYSKIYQQSSEIAESIELFSDMLQQSLKTKSDEKVSLASEIMYIKNFIQLQKLLQPNINVNFSYIGENEDIYIIPRLLFPFVENACKQRINDNTFYPIDIYIKTNNQKIVFFVGNKCNQDKENNNHYNVTQLLDLFYRDNYELKIEEKSGYLSIELSLARKILTKNSLAHTF